MKPFEPMPTLEGAVALPRVDPPTWSDEHPRHALGLHMLASLLVAAVAVANLRRGGFSWFFVVLLAIASSNVGYDLAQLRRRVPDRRDGRS